MRQNVDLRLNTGYMDEKIGRALKVSSIKVMGWRIHLTPERTVLMSMASIALAFPIYQMPYTLPREGRIEDE